MAQGCLKSPFSNRAQGEGRDLRGRSASNKGGDTWIARGMLQAGEMGRQRVSPKTPVGTAKDTKVDTYRK